jgi:uncharacterized phage-associated protein
MIYTSKQIADWFLGQADPEAGDSISPLKLQKLVYYAQAWHYTLFNKPLFNEDIEAWRHGPAIRSLYHRFEKYTRIDSIDISNEQLEQISFEEDTLDLLIEVKELYGEHSGSYLEKLTHSEEPWRIARGSTSIHDRCTTVISLQSMKNFYTKLLDERSKTQG